MLDISLAAPCASNPCENGGECEEITSDDGAIIYRCLCEVGFGGYNCQTEVCKLKNTRKKILSTSSSTKRII